MTVLEVMVRLNRGRIEDLKAVQKVVLGKVEAARCRDNKETLEIQHNVLAETVQELLRVVVVSRDVKHGLLVLDGHLGEVKVIARELPEALSVWIVLLQDSPTVVRERGDVDFLRFIMFIF